MLIRRFVKRGPCLLEDLKEGPMLMKKNIEEGPKLIRRLKTRGAMLIRRFKGGANAYKNDLLRGAHAN